MRRTNKQMREKKTQLKCVLEDSSHTFDSQNKKSFTSCFRILLHPQVGWELLQPSKLWGPASSVTLIPPSFGACESNNKPYNGYNNNEKPSNAYESVNSSAGAGGVVVRTEPDLVDNKQTEVSAYENIAFQFERGKNASPPKNQKIT